MSRLERGVMERIRPREWSSATAWWELGGYVSILGVATVMRLWDLGARAMHHDESLHALYAWNLYSGNGFQHNPMMHGPFQMEAIAGIFLVLSDSDYTARLLSAVAGIALVALPFLLRTRLGRVGALAVSLLLALSPVLLYFSRFARNDVIMAVWTLGLIISMWRYIDEGKRRYLYIASALLALAFATKETSYIVVTTLGAYLALLALSRSWPAIRQEITVGEVSPPAALVRVIGGVASGMARSLTLSGLSRPTGFLVLLVTLPLPLWAASISLLQDTPLFSWTGLVLANPVGGTGPIGAPSRGGLVIASLFVVALLWIAAIVGNKWSSSIWWRCALIFYAIWLLLQITWSPPVGTERTIFSYLSGVSSGFWQSLGYWAVQQGEARGAQPWYYYFMITSVYEFLPLLLGIAAGIYYLSREVILNRFLVVMTATTLVITVAYLFGSLTLIVGIIPVLYYLGRRDSFERFLIFWAVTTFILYTVAGEKMPWLLVNITLPLILLSGRLLGDLVREVEWRRVISSGSWLLLPAVPLFIVMSWSMAFVHMDVGQVGDGLLLGASLVALIGLAALGVYLARRLGARRFAALTLIPLALTLLVVSVRTGWYASYRNGDIPVELLVYTQTSPDVLRLVQYVEDAGYSDGDPTATPITIDQTSGFAWPWHWYFRDYSNIGYVSYDGGSDLSAPDSSVVLVHSGNKSKADPVFDERYMDGIRIKHRWWFPESYRGLTMGQFLGSFVDREAWRRAMDYFLYRKLTVPLGSEDTYAYFAPEFPSGYRPLN